MKFSSERYSYFKGGRINIPFLKFFVVNGFRKTKLLTLALSQFSASIREY